MNTSFSSMTCEQICQQLEIAAKTPNLPLDQEQAILNAEVIVRNAWGLHAKGAAATALEMCNGIGELEDAKQA